jgi:hypothetical protein
MKFPFREAPPNGRAASLMNIGERNEAEPGFKCRRGKRNKNDSDKYRESDDLGADFYQLVFDLLFLR